MAKKSKYTYYPNAKVTDELDGTEYTLGMTVETMTVEISGTSHPFYTGKEALVDTAGRIDKFKSRLEAKKTDSKEKTRKARKQKMSFEELMKQGSSQDEKSEEKLKKSDKFKKEEKPVKENIETSEEKHPKPKAEDAPKADEDTVKEQPKV